MEIRARVSGYLQSIHFEDGQIVQKGDLLFVIDRARSRRPWLPPRRSSPSRNARLDLANQQLARAGALRQRDFAVGQHL